MESSEDQNPQGWGSRDNVDPLADPQERAHLFSVLDSFRQYRANTHLITTHARRQAFYALPQAHWQRLAAPPINYLDTLSRVDDCIDANADIAEAICEVAAESFELPYSSPHTFLADDDEQDGGRGKPAWHNTATPLDLSKARSTINQLFRDWSSAGASERDLCHALVFSALNQSGMKPGSRVLVPGAGLGRLVLALAAGGYHTEGNEVSYHQLFASSFILNHSSKTEKWKVYPWCCNFSNRAKRADQLHEVRVPDVLPAEILSAAGENVGSMCMSSGDVCEVYGAPRDEDDMFDAVVTIFFIDTAPDLIKYIDTVSNVLRRGGLWINVGPLLWHFDGGPQQGKDEDQSGDVNGAADETQSTTSSQSKSRRQKIGSHGSFELSNDEVLLLIADSGFEVVKSDAPDESRETGYIQDQTSMLRYKYRPSHWVARKQ